MAEQKTSSGLGQAATPARAKVLIVDDNPANLLVLRAILSDRDEDLVEARSGEEALACLEQDDFAVVLLDVQMPGMNGLEVQDRLAGSGNAVPVIFITAHDEVGVREKALAGGAVAFLRKPFNDELFIKILRAALERGAIRN